MNKMKILGIALALMVTNGTCCATTIVVIKTARAIWIGSDGERTSYSPDESSEPVCKLHEIHGWLLAKAGISTDGDEDGPPYSVDKQVKRASEESTSISDLQKEIFSTFYKGAYGDARYLIDKAFPFIPGKPLDAYVFPGSPPQELLKHLAEHSRTAALFGYEANIFKEVMASAGPHIPTENPMSGYKILVGNSGGWDPLPYVTKSIALVAAPGDLTPYLPNDNWARNHPREAIKKILTASNKHWKKWSGPPNVIVRLEFSQESKPRDPYDQSNRKLKIIYVQRGACPAWNTETLDSESDSSLTNKH